MNDRLTAVVTTFSKEGHQRYAGNMLQSFAKNWPTAVDLYVYPDDRVKLPNKVNIHEVMHPIEAKLEFIKEHKPRRFHGFNLGAQYNYRFDLVKFCHKPFALQDCMNKYLLPCKYTDLIWLDADTITHSKVPMAAVSQMAPPEFDAQYLGRSYKYSECGYLYFNLKGRGPDLLNKWVEFYTTGAFIREAEWHDSFLFDQALATMPDDFRANDLTGHIPRSQGAGHPLINSFMGAYLDHYKGAARKATSRPRKGDLVTNHGNNPYWDKENPHAKNTRKKPRQES